MMSSCKQPWKLSSGELKAHAAAKQYDIPSSTLHDNVKGQKRYGGAPTVLTAAEEKEIVKACQALQEFGFPLTTDVVGQIVKDYLISTKRRNPFTDSTPGYESTLRVGSRQVDCIL